MGKSSNDNEKSCNKPEPFRLYQRCQVVEWQTTNVLRAITTVIVSEFPHNKDGDSLMYVWPCIIYENDEKYQLDATIMIYYHK